MPWNNPEVALETDVEYAKKLLADGGWADTDGDGIVEKNGIKAEFTCLYGQRRFRPSGCGYGGGGAASGRGHSDECGGHQLGRHFQAYVLQRGTHGWGAANPYESYCLYHSSYALRDDYYNPEGYSSPVHRRLPGGRHGSSGHRDSLPKLEAGQWDGSTGTSMKGQCPGSGLSMYSMCTTSAMAWTSAPQQLHPHGASMPLLKNLKDWTWTA